MQVSSVSALTGLIRRILTLAIVPTVLSGLLLLDLSASGTAAPPPWMSISYGTALSARDRQDESWVSKRTGIPELIAWANHVFLPPPKHVWVYIGPCGRSKLSAAFVSRSNSINICNEFVDEVFRDFLRSRPDLGGARRVTASFLAFAFLHELAHAIEYNYAIPVLGNREWSADEFAILTLMSNRNDDKIVLDASRWFLSVANSEGDARQLRFDDHPFSSERASAALCLLYGDDPSALRLLDQSTVSRLEQSNCVEGYLTSVWAWRKALYPYVRSHGNSHSLFR